MSHLQHLSIVGAEQLRPVDLASIRHVALDMDGTLYRGKTLFDFTLPFLARLDELGIGRTFLTNNCSKSRTEYLAHLRSFGIPADPDTLYTSGLCTVDYLRAERPDVRRLFVVGTAGLFQEFRTGGYTITAPDEEPDAVIVAFDTGLTFERLCKAAWWIKRGKPFIATHPDRTCPTDLDTILVDCGSICTALESATGVAPAMVLGKPHPLMLRGVLQRHGLAPHELAMVGDRLNTDVAMGRSAGSVSVLVLTGEAQREDVVRGHAMPDLIVPSIRELGELLAVAKEGKR